jgi:hypothetical protein
VTLMYKDPRKAQRSNLETTHTHLIYCGSNISMRVCTHHGVAAGGCPVQEKRSAFARNHSARTFEHRPSHGEEAQGQLSSKEVFVHAENLEAGMQKWLSAKPNVQFPRFA